MKKKEKEAKKRKDENDRQKGRGNEAGCCGEISEYISLLLLQLRYIGMGYIHSFCIRYRMKNDGD